MKMVVKMRGSWGLDLCAMRWRGMFPHWRGCVARHGNLRARPKVNPTAVALDSSHGGIVKVKGEIPGFGDAIEIPCDGAESEAHAHVELVQDHCEDLQGRGSTGEGGVFEMLGAST